MATRESIADILNRIALLLELKGENPFKTRAYKTGAEIVETFAGDIVQRATDRDLKGIKGIGSALADKLHELATTGQLGYYNDLRAEFPETIFDLFGISGLGPKKIKALYDALGVGSLPELKAACESGTAAALPGFGAKSVGKILDAIAFNEQHADLFRLGDVAADAERILDLLREHPAVSQASMAGSYRRGKEVLHDLDFLVATNDAPTVMAAFVSMADVASTLVQGDTKSSLRLESGLQCDLRAVTNAEFPFALNYFTGSKEHNVAMRSRALKWGYTLNEYRLAPCADRERQPLRREPIETENDIYLALGLQPVPPALRENNGEIEAAENDNLPRLVQLQNLRGTFHNHTTASDGKASLAAMADAARALGLQYLGISDHSKSSVQANGLSAERLLAQVAEIRELNTTFDDGFKVFAGVECDILKDGSLDYDDSILTQLDYVVASVHSSFTLAEAEMTARVIRAVENPHVTMLGHLTGRLLLTRKPYAINVPKIIDACAANGTIIEINANPRRLDMDWRWWKLAKEKGVRCSINPDAHRTEHFQFLHFGVMVAQKGWLTREDVVNCLPLDEIETLLQSKS